MLAEMPQQPAATQTTICRVSKNTPFKSKESVRFVMLLKY